ncbi:MAG: hypothetical protein WC470_01795 [Candidatus Paceibacterota bacterium]
MAAKNEILIEEKKFDKKQFVENQKKAKIKTLKILLPLLLVTAISFFINPIFFGIMVIILGAAIFYTWYYILVKEKLFGSSVPEGYYIVITEGEGRLKNIIFNKRGEALSKNFERVPENSILARKQFRVKGVYPINSLFQQVQVAEYKWKKAIINPDGTVKIIERSELLIARAMVDHPQAILINMAESSDQVKINMILTFVFYVKNPYKAESNTATRWIALAEIKMQSAGTDWVKEHPYADIFAKSHADVGHDLYDFINEKRKAIGPDGEEIAWSHAGQLEEDYGIGVRSIVLLYLEQSDTEVAKASQREEIARLNQAAAKVEAETNAIRNSQDITGTADYMLAQEMGISLDELKEKKKEPGFVELVRPRLDHFMGVAQRTLANKNGNYFDLNTGISGERNGMAASVFEAAVAANIATRGIGQSNNSNQSSQSTQSQKSTSSENKKSSSSEEDNNQGDNNEILTPQDIVKGKRLKNM